MAMAMQVLFVSLSCALLAQGVRHKRARTIAGLTVHNDHADAEDFILLFRKGSSDATIKYLCQHRCSFEGHPSQGGVPFAVVHGRDVVQELLSKNNDGSVEFLEADIVDTLSPEVVTEEGPHTSSMGLWGLTRIGAPDRTHTGRGVTIFIQDTGIRTSHSDFGGRAISTIDLTYWALEVCDEDTPSCSADGNGHGTHCAGTAAGSTLGVAPDATLRASKTLEDDGRGQRSWQMTSIDWIATTTYRPLVLSMSLGGKGRDYDYTVAIDAAIEAGITVVVAGGNENAQACHFSPAFVPGAITVGSTDSSDQRSFFSNYGWCVDIWAPGSRVESASHISDQGTTQMSGTSMACPHVAGAAALLLEANPGLQAEGVLEAMYARAEVGAITDLKPGDKNQFLWVGAGGVPARRSKCDNGCPIMDPSHIDDGICNCAECEDESLFDCTSCSGGCPDQSEECGIVSWCGA